MLGLTHSWMAYILALAVAVLSVAAIPKDAPRGNNPAPWHAPNPPLPHDPFVPFFSACDVEVRQLCAQHKDTPLKCLVKYLPVIRRNKSAPQKFWFSEECARWLLDRDECVNSVREAKICKPKETAAECLRRVPLHSLPPCCRHTSYYRTVMLYGQLNKKREDMDHNYLKQ